MRPLTSIEGRNGITGDSFRPSGKTQLDCDERREVSGVQYKLARPF